ncbi:SPOR domain-containing protein [Novosphingobium sp.]|uniref:SPOR domain-containing protein n=1 Tax=Novosphingobium sp. TaxID=1874826 RepID=UPI0027371968|nr:SPOR domain-containing protein [Novosphingobium sp.]MDP3908090.1 SPOR domain-containing protein [Novosphingobium sp.]
MTGATDDRIKGDEPQPWETGAEDHDEQPLETEQLDLTEEEERLPWLESPEDDEWDDSQSSDNSKLAGFVLMGLVALAAIVGGIWWATNRGPDPALVADGSVIEAPGQPYKEAPQDPGGKTFDGTGDSSFAVSEGQNRPPQLGGEAGAPAAAPAQAAAPAAAAPAPAAASGGVGVQVGAFSSQATAEAGWTKLAAQAGAVLSGVPHRVVSGSADIGTVYRLQAIAPDAAAAQALCGKLKAAGISCQVK